jgi:hypothetical protein
MKYPPRIKRVGRAAGDLLAAARRRGPDSRARVRVRLAHGEARVLTEDAPERERLLSLAERLVSEYGGSSRAGR